MFNWKVWYYGNIEEFPDLITILLNDKKTPTKLGDVNIPQNKEDHMDTKLMQDTINLFYLFQNVTFQTHKAGNILDWILTTIESHKENLISDITNQDFLSDHCIIKFKTALLRPATEKILNSQKP